MSDCVLLTSREYMFADLPWQKPNLELQYFPGLQSPSLKQLTKILK